MTGKELLQAWGRLPMLALRAIAEVLMSVVRLLARLLGVRGPGPAAPLPIPTTTPADVRADLREGIERALQGDVQPTHGPGTAVHAYAAAAPADRTSVDLSPLTATQAAWLLALADDDLRRLASAGPAACQRAVDGRRSGVVGLPVPGGLTEEDRAESRDARIRAALRDRILAGRGYLGATPAA